MFLPIIQPRIFLLFYFKLMEQNERKMASDAVMIKIIETLFIKGGDNKAVAIRIFRMYAKFGAFSPTVLEYARGIGLMSALTVQAKLGYEKCKDAAVSILSEAHSWDFLAEKENWRALAEAQKWNFLIENEQWDILAEYQQWNIIAEHEKWDVLARYKRWNILAEYRQWSLLKDHSRWFELLCAGQFENVPRQAMVGYAFMRCFMK